MKLIYLRIYVLKTVAKLHEIVIRPGKINLICMIFNFYQKKKHYSVWVYLFWGIMLKIIYYLMCRLNFDTLRFNLFI